MKKILNALFAAAVATGFAGTAHAADKVVVVLDWPYPIATHAGLRLAEVKGWYKEANLDVDIQMGKGSVTTIQQVGAGQADIGEVNTSAAAGSISSGLPVITVMGMSQQADLGALMGADTGFKTAKDMKGKKLGAPSAGATNLLLPSFLEKLGLTKNDVEITYVDSNALLGIYTSKQVDGLVVGTTYAIPRVEDKRQGVTLLFSEVGLSMPGYGLVANKNAIQDKAKAAVLAKFVQINQRAWTYILDGHQQEAIDAIVKTGEQFRPDPKPMALELKLQLELFTTPNTKGHAIGWESKTDWENALKAMETVGIIKTGWKVEDYFTNALVTDK